MVHFKKSFIYESYTYNGRNSACVLILGKHASCSPTTDQWVAGHAGAALLYALDIDSSKARYIGPQVLFGIGISLGSQVPTIRTKATKAMNGRLLTPLVIAGWSWMDWK
ncbi:hypothetical protein V1527DRAFT_454593 [Lipomyces starkeyi]